MANRYYSAIAIDNTLGSSITSTSTSMILNITPVGYPSSFPFVLAVDYNTSLEELVLVTASSGTTLTITRGYNGTTAVSHGVGAVVRHVITAQDMTDAQNHYALGLTGGAHGVTGALATFLGTPTSTNFAAVLSDETGTGPAVFSQSPTLNNLSLTGTLNAGGTTGSAGYVLTSSGTGVAWQAAASSALSFDAQTGTTYTLVIGDVYGLVTLSNAGAITLTVPPSVFTAGQYVNIQQIGAGQVTIVAGSGVTITSTGATSASPKLAAQYAAATIICTASNTFTVVGNIV